MGNMGKGKEEMGEVGLGAIKCEGGEIYKHREAIRAPA